MKKFRVGTGNDLGGTLLIEAHLFTTDRAGNLLFWDGQAEMIVAINARGWNFCAELNSGMVVKEE